MYPSWGGYGGHQPPPHHFGVRPPPMRAPPPQGAGFAGYGGAPPAAPSNFSSLREQHLQQMQQLQQLHQKQLQSVLHQNSGYGGAARGPPEPAAATPATAEENVDLSAMSLQEQQQFWYKQHLQNLQKLKNEREKLQTPDTTAPPPPVEPPKKTPPPPPPKDEPPPPPPPDGSKPSGITDPGDAVEAARLQQLQAAAAQWQQTQQQRAGFQYQALMQQHAQLQQILQRYQQLIQQPAHLQTMPLDVQLRHYEVQQQQFSPVFQEWDRQFRLWQDQFQAYPHKDQLQDYESQWKQWQDQMTSTSAHLQERVTSLRAARQQQFGAVGQYPGAETPLPAGHQPVLPAPHAQPPGPSAPAAEPYPAVGPEKVSEPPPLPPPPPPPPHGPRGPRFVGPRGGPRFDQPPHLRFNGPPRFEPRQRFGPPPRGNQPHPGPPRGFEAPQRLNSPRFERPHELGPPPFAPPCFERPPGPPMNNQARFERPPGPPPSLQLRFERPPAPLQSSVFSQAKPEHVPQTQQTEPKTPAAVQVQSDAQKQSKDNGTPDSMTEDLLDSGEGFFVQSDPIPQTSVPSKTDQKVHDKSPDATKEPVPDKEPVLPHTAGVASQNSPNQGPGQPSSNGGSVAAQKLHPPDTPSQPPGLQHGQNQVVPPHVGRGRGHMPLPVRGRGRARGRGHPAGPIGPPHDFNPAEEGRGPFGYGPQNMAEPEFEWEDPSLEPPARMAGRRPQLHEEDMWQPEEHHFAKEYCEETEDQGPPLASEELEGSCGHWEEGEPEYWEEEEPYWVERRPPMRGRLPFSLEGHRHPFPPPRFMHRGLPRRPPPPHHRPPGEHNLHIPPQRNPVGPPIRPRGPPLHPGMMERDLRRPPHPLEKGQRGPPPYLEEHGWPRPPRGRGSWRPPPPPHAMLRRPPFVPPHAMERRHPPPAHEHMEEPYENEYEEDYGPQEDGYRRPPCEYHDYEHGQDEYYPPPSEDWEHPPYPRRGPPDRKREDQWLEDREMGHPYGEGDRRRPGPRSGERPYPDPPDWERPLPERNYPAEKALDVPPPPPLAPPVSLPDPALEQSSPGAGKGMLALSQRQHEIILKAAQELKMIRELQESKNVQGEQDVKPEFPSGLLGLEIPPEVKSALQATSLLAEAGNPASWETGLSVQGQPAGTAPVLKTPIIAKTVDYGHGHESGATVERISYGERIVLRPDPQPERAYEKEPLGLRDPYSREPYLERRGDPYRERRDRDPYRERSGIGYERERYLRDERPPPGPPPPRLGYRDRDVREREGRGSRDREVYGRPLYERPPYERGPERGTPAYANDRRSFPDERPPPPAAPLPPAPAAPPRVEKKPETVNVDDLLKPPGRSNRPERIVIIMRGLSGSGKSHVAKLIRDREVECGGAPPRIVGLDDYFMTEVEKVEKDPDTGKRVKNKVLEYEYEPEMEDTYRSSMLKTFRKTLDDGFFPFIIIDAVNDKVKHFDQFWSAAKTKGFEVYLAEICADHQTCAKRNIHGRKLKDIMKMVSAWEPTPRHMVRLDIRSLLQDAAIEDVEMEDFNPSEDEPKAEPEEEEADLGYVPKSKWEMDTSEAKLDKLDGLVSGGKRKRDSDMSGMEDFLQLPDDYATRMSEPGKKRVRWADLEEKKDADRKRAIGFVVGQTDWEKITDETGQLAQRALNRTKYF
ncbi:YLP motif-containing protein 1 [Denticeps clupeoides]|uniref:YLP motif-containing protein 1 n=1 Tax=Denticeps clupeoides TaxID=299321 RepID=UPI0010A3ECAC|nr:YLP motif-containing protein 1 [Denticeps clupeoides]